MKKSFLLSFLLLSSSLVFAAFPVSTTIATTLIEPETSFHFGGFMLGFLLGIYGVVIAYLMNKKDVIKSAWIGFGVIAFLIISIYAFLFYSLSVNGGNGYSYF